MLKVGVPAPNFIADSTGGTVHLKDYIRAKTVLLCFYPNNASQEAQEQLTEIQNCLEEFSRLDTQILGISTESLESQYNYSREVGIKFPLISDLEMEIAKKYGIDPEQTTLVIIDLDGVICYGREKTVVPGDLLREIERAI